MLKFLSLKDEFPGSLLEEAQIQKVIFD